MTLQDTSARSADPPKHAWRLGLRSGPCLAPMIAGIKPRRLFTARSGMSYRLLAACHRYRLALSLGRREMRLVPAHAAIHQVHEMFWFGEAVPLARVAHHHGLDPDVLERDVELLRLRDGHVVVVLTMDQHGGRLHLRDVLECGALPEPRHQVALVRQYAPLHLLVHVVVGHVVVAEVVDDGRQRDRGLEDVRLRDQPGGELAAVTAALDAKPVAVDPRISTERGGDAVENVLRLATVLVAENGIGERLPVAGGAAEVDLDAGPAAGGIVLRAEIEGRSLRAVRSAVNYHDQWMLRARCQVERPRQVGLDLVLEVVAHEAKRLYGRNGDVFQHVCVEIGQPPSRRAAVLDVELREVA